MTSDDLKDVLKYITPVKVLKWGGVVFAYTLGILFIIWIILWMTGNTDSSSPTTTTTTTVTTPAITTETTTTP